MEIEAAAEPTDGKEARFVEAGLKEHGHMKAGAGCGQSKQSDYTF